MTATPARPTVSAWRTHATALAQAQARAHMAERVFLAAWRERQSARRALRVIERTHP